MLVFRIFRQVSIEREDIFSISVDVENFSTLLPKYFKSLKIQTKKNREIFVDEKISFMGKIMSTKTMHIIKPPNKHDIHILSGPLKHSQFEEFYEKSDSGTQVTIIVKLKFNGVFKIFYLFKPLIKLQINKVMDEFISACEIQTQGYQN